MDWLKIPKKVYFKRGSYAVALKEVYEVYGCKKAFIISDANLYVNGIAKPVVDQMRNNGVRPAEFFSFDEVPTFENIRSGLPKMDEFQPDVIIAVGGAGVIGAAKLMWALYENPELDLAECAKKFAASTAAGFPAMGKKAMMVAISTNPGDNASVTPFASVADDAGNKVCISSYNLLPEIAVIDAEFFNTLTAEEIKTSALTALTLAVRAYCAEGVTDYVKGFCEDAVAIITAKTEFAMNGCPVARESLANASAIASMAFANAVETLDPSAVWFPNADEKKAAKDEKLAELAKFAGLKDAAELIAKAEAIAAL